MPVTPADDDPQRFADYAYRVDALLQSMEPTFKKVDAEEGGAKPTEVEYMFTAEEPVVDYMVGAMIGWRVNGDKDALDVLVNVAEHLIKSLVNASVPLGWYAAPFVMKEYGEG